MRDGIFVPKAYPRHPTLSHTSHTLPRLGTDNDTVGQTGEETRVANRAKEAATRTTLLVASCRNNQQKNVVQISTRTTQRRLAAA